MEKGPGLEGNTIQHFTSLSLISSYHHIIRIDYADGAYYEGFYLDDLKHGQGTFEMKG
jgi:hypothetical protein